MAEIKVSRGADFGGLLRRMKVEVDGAVVAAVKQNGSVTVEVDPGSHVVRVRQDWMASAPVTVHVDAGGSAALHAEVPERALTLTVLLFRSGSALELRPLPVTHRRSGGRDSAE